MLEMSVMLVSDWQLVTRVRSLSEGGAVFPGAHCPIIIQLFSGTRSRASDRGSERRAKSLLRNEMFVCLHVKTATTQTPNKH